MKMRPRHAIAARSLMVFASLATGTARAASVKASLYHGPGCRCREPYADCLNAKGYDVEIRNTNDMAVLNDRYGVKPGLSFGGVAVWRLSGAGLRSAGTRWPRPAYGPFYSVRGPARS